MRFILTIIISCILSITSTYAQSPIEGFWGIKLGESQSIVVNKVKKLYPSSEWSRDSKGNYYVARQVHIAGLEAGACEFRFTNGVLTKAEFIICPSGGRNVPASQVEAQIQRDISAVQSVYEEFSNVFASKYGTPNIAGEIITWRSNNGNSITIKPWINTYENTIGYDVGYWWVAMGIYVTYAKGTHVNDF